MDNCHQHSEMLSPTSPPKNPENNKAKTSLYSISPSNYCTVSLLPFKAKTLKIIVCAHYLQFLSICSPLKPLQSGFTPAAAPELVHSLPSFYSTTSNIWQSWSTSSPWTHFLYLFSKPTQSPFFLPQYNFYYFLLISQISNNKNTPDHFSVF